jgi:hypothetical protein
MPPLSDLVGKRFTRWTVLSYVGKSQWLCRCDCGKEKTVLTGNLTSEASRSCGCLSIEEFVRRSRTHGGSSWPEYQVYYAMIARCFHPQDDAFKDYGGRGITICERWLGKDGFRNFIADMGRRLSPELTIDRINNDGNYEPDNCAWRTRHENNMNKRKRPRKGEL